MATLKRIEQKMIDFLEGKLKGNGLYEEALIKNDARTVFLLAAQVCVGIRERGGNNRGPMVELIQETIGGHSSEAWCMSYVQTCLAYAEHKTGVKSPIEVSEGCDQVWTRTPKQWRVQRSPLAAAIVIWGKYNSKGHYLGGHTGILESTDGETMFVYEGNTTSGLNATEEVVREGGGCYRTHRNFKANGNMKVRGFLIPFPKK